MPIPSPFHDRLQRLNRSCLWKDWAGYLAPCRFDASHEKEYFALREAAGLIDVTPLFKYEVEGVDAGALLARMTVRDVTRLRRGRVTYCCWCDDDGKVIDDGTITRFGERSFRLTAALPTLRWISSLARGYRVSIQDSSRRIGALALQGPTSRKILGDCTDADVDSLRFFRATAARLGGIDVQITRTGYTGDLGYEIWVDVRQALPVWDAIVHAGRRHGLQPAGLDALDMTRIEAGFIMLEVDYYSSSRVVLESRKSSPYEIGLGWTVQLARDPFVGQRALREEASREPAWRLVGLEASWEELEALYDRHGLPPALPAEARRDPLPVYCDGRQVGRATSHTWSPILKKSIALASVMASYAEAGRRLQLEHTVEFERQTVACTVVETPFFDPERKRKS